MSTRRDVIVNSLQTIGLVIGVFCLIIGIALLTDHAFDQADKRDLQDYAKWTSDCKSIEGAKVLIIGTEATCLVNHWVISTTEVP